MIPEKSSIFSETKSFSIGGTREKFIKFIVWVAWSHLRMIKFYASWGEIIRPDNNYNFVCVCVCMQAGTFRDKSKPLSSPKQPCNCPKAWYEMLAFAW